MKRTSERRIVVVLFVLVFITFSFAHEDSKKLEQIYSGTKTVPAVELTALQETIQVDKTLTLTENLSEEKITPQ